MGSSAVATRGGNVLQGRVHHLVAVREAPKAGAPPRGHTASGGGALGVGGRGAGSAPQLGGCVREQAVLLDKLERDARSLTEEAEACEKEARRIAEHVLPQLMDEAGLPAIELDDDTRIERGEDVYASISAANAPAATAWLEKNGYGAIVKFGFMIPIDKGDTELATHIRGVLERARIGYEEKGGVHAATLTAFVKEAIGAGRPLPPSITHHVQPRVRVKKAKKRAASGRKQRAD